MINATVEDWFADHVGVDFATLHVARNAAIPVVSLNVEFTNPSRIGERLEFFLKPVRVGRTSVDLRVTAAHKSEPRLRSQVRLVHISKDDYRPREWPDEFKARFAVAEQ